MHASAIIPLFPLGLVLMPHMRLPLHIFEERYKIMVAECLKENNPFGIVYFEGKDISYAGCTARVVEVLKRYESGEMDIMTVGEDRFTINRLHDTAPYLEADVTYFDDEPENESSDLLELAKEGLGCLQQLGTLGGDTADTGYMEGLSLKRISFAISQNENFSLQEKQRFLEMTSTRKRLEAGVKTLQLAIRRAELTLEIHNIIGGNGNIGKILKKR